jgi:hypothetical protein
MSEIGIETKNEASLDSVDANITPEERKFQVRSDFEDKILWETRNDLGLKITDVKPVIEAVLYCIYNNPYENIEVSEDMLDSQKSEKNVFWTTLFSNFSEVQNHNPESTKNILNTPKKRELFRHITGYVFKNMDYFTAQSKDELLHFFNSFIAR